jgi:hypothetical protein
MVSARNGPETFRHLGAQLEALGYRALPSALWPVGVMGAYRNADGDTVLVTRDRVGCLVLQPADHKAVA